MTVKGSAFSLHQALLDIIVPPTPVEAHPDTAATGHFLPVGYKGKLLPNEDIEVICANGASMHSVETQELDIPSLPATAKKAHTFREMDKALLSVPELVDADCNVNFDKSSVVVINNKTKQVILEGKRDPATRLWLVPIIQQKLQQQQSKVNHNISVPHTVNSAYHQKTISKLIQFLHATAGSPPVKTWCNAIDSNFFSTWPGLTSQAVRKHLPKSEATTMGHLHMIRKGTRSTSTKPTIEEIMEEESEPEPKLEPPRSNRDRKHLVGVSSFKFEELRGISASDLPGRFPLTSAQGNAYVMVLYDTDSNAIQAVPIQNRKTEEIVRGYKEMTDELRKAGIQPIVHRLDNETSSELIKAIEDRGIDYQVASPGDHRLNHAERAIQTFKNHFISNLYGTDSTFPANQWCRLIRQAVMTLNMCRASRINPKLSAYQQIWGNFDFNRTPMAPPGCRVIVHERALERGAWASHGIGGYYIRPAMHHYRNYKAYIPETRGIRTTNTIEFFPDKVTMPATSSADRLAAATEDLVAALGNPHPPIPFLDQGTVTNDAIKKLQSIYLSPRNDESSPRVLKKTDSVPRVLNRTTNRLRTILEENEIFPNGTEIMKKFNGSNIYRGKVTSHNEETDLYRIDYTDGDWEEMNRKQVNKYKCPDSEKDRWTRFTRAALRQQVNAVTSKGSPTVALPPHYAMAVFDEKSGKMLDYRQLINHPDPEIRKIWQLSVSNEFGRTMQGVGKNRTKDKRIKGTDTMKFIHKHKIPKNKKVTYARFVCDLRLQKDEIHRTRMTAGGDRLDYDGKTSTETASLGTTKIHLNSTISTRRARYLCLDIGNMYLNTKLLSPEYMRIHISLIPDEIKEEYNVDQFVDEDGYVYVEITGAIYGLSQSGYLAHEDLKKNLAEFGYAPAKRTHGLWFHKTRNISFTLVVDDFGVKYVDKADALHLINALETHYPLKIDWTGSKYIGIDLTWDYENGTVVLSMKDYVKKALKQFMHETAPKHFDGPTKYIPPEYGKKVQYEKHDTSAPLDKKGIKFIQEVCGKFLYTARAVDNTMLHALNELCIAATKGTKQTGEALEYFLNYCASNQSAGIIYRASDMILTIHSDAAYLVAAMARSRAAGYHFFGNKDGKLFNGPIFVLAKIIKNVMGSAAEAETGGLYMNAQEAVPERITAEELGHIQPPTPLVTDNSTADGIMNKTVKQKQSKAMDMRFYWLQDRVEQGQFNVYWAPGKYNLADYFSKLHPPSHHRKMRPIYLYNEGTSPTTLQGCVEILSRAQSSHTRVARAPIMSALMTRVKRLRLETH
jgi:hypothetical protein